MKDELYVCVVRFERRESTDMLPVITDHYPDDREIVAEVKRRYRDSLGDSRINVNEINGPWTVPDLYMEATAPASTNDSEAREQEPVLYKSGDVVRLKSGGPVMTVIAKTALMPDSVFCGWFARGRFKKIAVDHAALKPVRRKTRGTLPEGDE